MRSTFCRRLYASQILRRRYDSVLERELDALRGKLRYGIAHDLEPWRRSVHATISSAMEGTRDAVLAVFGELASGTEKTETAELAYVHDLQSEVVGLRAKVESAVPS